MELIHLGSKAFIYNYKNRIKTKKITLLLYDIMSLMNTITKKMNIRTIC